MMMRCSRCSVVGDTGVYECEMESVGDCGRRGSAQDKQNGRNTHGVGGGVV